MEIDGLLTGTEIDELIGAVDRYPVQEVPESLKCHSSIISIVVVFRAAMYKYPAQLRALVSDILQSICIGASECSYMVGIIVDGQVRAPERCLMQ